MSFAWPNLLYLLIIPLALVIWEWRHRQHRRVSHHPKILQAEAGQQHLRLQGQGATRQSRARLWLYVGVMLAVVSLARPQWGQLEEPVFDQSREILIAIDLSRSMLAQDVKPSRLERSKLLISSLLEKLEGERVGLIVFSGTAFLQSPLSADYEILREFLPALDPEYLPEGGTNYQALVETTVSAFATSGSADRFLIVLSDGEATDENWQDLIEKLQKKNIRTISLGIGTAAGAMIPDGSGAFVKDDRGAVVLSKLSTNTLRDLAQQTNGVYRDASSWVDLSALLEETVEAGRKGEFVEKNTVRLVERFQWPLIPALICLLMSLWREFPVRPRPRALKIAPLLLAAFLLTPRPISHAQETPTEPELTPLGKIVSRLSTQKTKSGRDWAELARETVTWGQKLKTGQQPVPSVPVNDALLAVKLGSQLDPKTADWDQLRRELEALLEKPEQQQQDEKQQQKQDQQDQEQKSDQQQQSQDGQQNDQPQSSQDQQSSEGSPQNQPQQSKQDEKSSDDQSGSSGNEPQDQEPQDKESAFGDMNEEPEAPQPQSGEMQQVGGAEQKSDASPEQKDPALAVPLQRLQKIRDQDSPAKLFQMMDDSPESSPKQKGKTW